MNTILETERLEFHELHRGDADFIFELVNDPDWQTNIGDPGVGSLEEAQRFIEDRFVAMYAKHSHGLYRVDLKETGEAIGICGLINREGLNGIDLGFATLPRFRKQGYTYEAAVAMMSHGVNEHGLSKLLAISKPGNDASHRLLEKLGFRFERLVQMNDSSEEDMLYVVDLSA